MLLTDEDLIAWRRGVVTKMLINGICIESIIPNVMVAEKFIESGEYPDHWENDEVAKNQNDGS